MPRLLHPRNILLIGLALAPATALAIAGTSEIASEGQPVTPAGNWPEGLAALVNDPARIDGWSDWFSEWPNDVVHFRFRAANTAEVNALLKKFAQVRSKPLQVRLSPLPEPRGFGWVSSFPKDNGTPVVLSFGDQERLDEWFRGLPGGKFGVMEFEKAPVAVPPTLTIYTRNQAIDLGRLEIPESLEVSAGDLPRLFGEANLKPPASGEKETKADEGPDAEEIAKETAKINAYLEQRKSRIDKKAGAKDGR